jgi:hypothetical protein
MRNLSMIRLLLLNISSIEMILSEEEKSMVTHMGGMSTKEKSSIIGCIIRCKSKP